MLALDRVLALLEELFPLSRAESWDNVGLLVGALGDRRNRALPAEVRRVLLTIDLTDPVLSEALAADVDLVLSYHPPLFRPIKRLDPAVPGERRLLELARAGVALYSPHTALDAAPGGVNDFLADGLGAGERQPLVPARLLPPTEELKLVTFVPEEHADRLAAALSLAGAGVIGDYRDCSSRTASVGTFRGGALTNPTVGEREKLEYVPEVRLEMVCPKRALADVARVMRDVHPYEEPAWDLYPLAPRPLFDAGQGRLLTLAEPATLPVLVERLKIRLRRSLLRVARAEPERSGMHVKTVAVCAGSGNGLVHEAAQADLYVTGELSHHRVLELTDAGTSVVLCEHSSSERGYLPQLATLLQNAGAGGLEVLVSEADQEPLEPF